MEHFIATCCLAHDLDACNSKLMEHINFVLWFQQEPLPSLLVGLKEATASYFSSLHNHQNDEQNFQVRSTLKG